MSHDTAVEVRGVGKRYEIGAGQGGYQTLTERLSTQVRSLGRRQAPEEFWALRDISFTVERGQTLGIIGHNGAGKSTLLKILSRITPPTEGELRLRGRVGALLEVGTGFHPELTGRENVFLNGAILSMKHEEIRRKFDEIVEFADVASFIDTPVKRYSSGMQMRLAFSVAAHLDPEILIVDEVLSVGDLAFQQKCLERIQNAAREGRTVIFISHNMQSVINLCDTAMMLANGGVVVHGKVGDVVDEYVGDVMDDIKLGLREREHRNGNGKLRFTDIHLERDGKVIDSPITGDRFDIVVAFEKHTGESLRAPNFSITVSNLADGTPLLDLDSGAAGAVFTEVPESGVVRLHVDRCPLPAGQYYVDVRADSGTEVLDAVGHGTEITVAAGDFYGSGRQSILGYRAVMIDHAWTLEAADTGVSVPDGSASRA